MIQRIQSVYLLVADLLLLISVFLSWVNYGEGELALKFDPLDFEGNGWFVGIALLLSGSEGFAAIFLFKNRALQIKIVQTAMALNIAGIAAFSILHYNHISSIALEQSPGLNYGMGPILPLVALVFQYLALRAIKRDDILVKSVDRLR